MVSSFNQLSYCCFFFVTDFVFSCMMSQSRSLILSVGFGMVLYGGFVAIISHGVDMKPVIHISRYREGVRGMFWRCVLFFLCHTSLVS